jgi:hypothetical protein
MSLLAAAGASNDHIALHCIAHSHCLTPARNDQGFRRRNVQERVRILVKLTRIIKTDWTSKLFILTGQ